MILAPAPIQSKFNELLSSIALEPLQNFNAEIELVIKSLNRDPNQSISLNLFGLRVIKINTQNKAALFSTIQKILRGCPSIQKIKFNKKETIVTEHTITFGDPSISPTDINDLIGFLANSNVEEINFNVDNDDTSLAKIIKNLKHNSDIKNIEDWIEELIDIITDKTCIVDIELPSFLPTKLLDNIKQKTCGLLEKVKKEVGDARVVGSIIHRFQSAQDPNQLIMSFLGDSTHLHQAMIRGANHKKGGIPYKAYDPTRAFQKIMEEESEEDVLMPESLMDMQLPNKKKRISE